MTPGSFLFAPTALLARGSVVTTSAVAAVPHPVPPGTRAADVELVVSARVVQPTGTARGAGPMVAFGHGFLQPSSGYTGTWTSIASRG